MYIGYNAKQSHKISDLNSLLLVLIKVRFEAEI